MKYGIYANEEEVVGGARCCFSISVFCLFVCLFFFCLCVSLIFCWKYYSNFTLLA